MSSPAVVAHPKDSVEDAALIMAEAKIGCLPVVDDQDGLVGLVTETDLLQYFAHASAASSSSYSRSSSSSSPEHLRQNRLVELARASCRIL